MKHINEYNVFDKINLDWHPDEDDAKELAKVIESRLLEDAGKVIVQPVQDGTITNFQLMVKYQQLDAGNILININMQTNQLMLNIKTDYTIGDTHEYEVNLWRVERNDEDEEWEDLLFRIENPIHKGLEHIETLQELEKKLKDSWHESTWDYPLKTGSTIEKGKVIYNVK